MTECDSETRTQTFVSMHHIVCYHVALCMHSNIHRFAKIRNRSVLQSIFLQ